MNKSQTLKTAIKDRGPVFKSRLSSILHVIKAKFKPSLGCLFLKCGVQAYNLQLSQDLSLVLALGKDCLSSKLSLSLVLALGKDCLSSKLSLSLVLALGKLSLRSKLSLTLVLNLKTGP